MQQSIRQQLERVRQPLHSAATLPPACYTDADWLRQEQQTLFGDAWIVAGRRDRWQQPGDFVCLEVAGAPLVITLDAEHQLHALANSCRHRGMQIQTGSGNCKQLVCPFHAWTYNLCGKLISAPRMENCVQSETGFDPANYTLPSIRVAESDGFVFVCMSPEQHPLQDWLADFRDIHQPWSLEDWVTTRINTFSVDCNWKAFIEVFNEYYHLPYVHPDSLSDLYQEPDPPDAVIGEYASQFGITRGTAGLLQADKDLSLPSAPSLEGRNLLGTRYTWVFPNMTFAACSDSLWMYQAFPLTVNCCRVIQTICFPAASVALKDFEQRVQGYYDRIDAALAEDLPFLQQQQTGLSSPLARQGRFSALEPCVGHFACWYAQQMAAAT